MGGKLIEEDLLEMWVGDRGGSVEIPMDHEMIQDHIAGNVTQIYGAWGIGIEWR